MSRWEPNARGRLQEAAIASFLEVGFDRTTVAEIARRAGLTERTFFRYFADKREVLFYGSEMLLETLVRAVDDAPSSLSPIDLAAHGILAIARTFDGRYETARVRNGIVASHAELQERELMKMATLRSALADALRRRGVPDGAAALAADMGIAVFFRSFERWVASDGRRAITEVARDAFEELATVAAGLTPSAARI